MITYTQKQTYSNAVSDLSLIAKSLKEAGYLGADAQAAHYYTLKAADALADALEHRDVIG